MGKRATRSARSRALLAGAVVLATATAWHPASAAPPPAPGVTLDDGGDGWVNVAEASAITISGTYDTMVTPAITQVVARIVASATCADIVSPSTPAPTFAVNPDGTWVSPAFDISGFPHGSILCARARAKNADGTGALGTSQTSRLDLTIPAAPVIVSPQQNQLAPERFTLTGTLATPIDPGTTVEAFVVTTAPPVSLGTAIVGPGGGWDMPATMPSSGTHQLQAQATDAAGNVGPLSAIRVIDVDAAAPTVTIELPANNSILLPGDDFTLEGVAEDQGSGILAVEVHVFSFGTQVNTTQIKNFTCTSGCPTNLKVKWSYSPPVGTGYFTVKIWAIDVAGNRTPQPAEVNVLKIL